MEGSSEWRQTPALARKLGDQFSIGPSGELSQSTAEILAVFKKGGTDKRVSLSDEEWIIIIHTSCEKAKRKG